MNKISTYLVTAFLLFFLGCASTHFSNYWPYSQVPPMKVKDMVPKKYETIIPNLDSILSPIAKKHFKNQDSSIAVIEICTEIGGFFSTNWGLYRYNKKYHWPYDGSVELPEKPIGIISKFISDGIYHPEAMLRIMFTCYYKYLNGQDYNWENEINQTKALWPMSDPTNYAIDLPDTVAKLESQKMSNYYFGLLNTNDTVNILYNRQPKLTKKSSDWYYITGIINYKIPESEAISIRIVKIESEFNQNFYVTGSDTINQGDTIVQFHKDWLSRNHYYFNYHKCKEQREAFNVL